MNKLKYKTLRYKIGYWFFLILALVGLSDQMYKYITNTLVLSYQELIVTSVLSVLLVRPMGFIELIDFVVKKEK